MSSNSGVRWLAASLRAARRLAPLALPVVALVALAGCASEAYPNTTFNYTTEVNEITDQLWDRLLFWATLVFVIVQVGLLYIVFRFKAKPGQPNPSHVHGNTALEIAWTAIPAVILAFIAVPTVKAIFQTQAKAPATALQVEVIGHQWWWEFKYPQYGITTANELYLPTGRPVNFALKTADVLHSFWIPRLGGKRDLISNRTNYLWFTPRDSMALKALNGTCNEYCGASHANMKFRVFTVTPAQFASWAAHQKAPAVFGAVVPAPVTPATAPAAASESTTRGGQVGTALASAEPATPVGFVFPRERIEPHTIPTATAPAGLTIQAGLTGDAERGRQVYSRSSCIGCHKIAGNPASAGVVGPNLTHLGSRYTIGAGLYANTPELLALWIKNAPAMKPGSIMPALGKGEWNPATKAKVTLGGLTDQEIVDIAAYLTALK
ncbi:MAG: cytochrome c oxidase subunit II [Gemmatimonadaceae bacterium]|jgi:cytochrome c oxidase subunit 2|nr:cytochrome c oxidase subunit II [Gemmatimonadaceae bacterium]